MGKRGKGIKITKEKERNQESMKDSREGEQQLNICFTSDNVTIVT